MAGILILLGTVCFFAAFIYAIRVENREADKVLAKLEKESQDWLAAQNSLLKYVVRITTKTNKVYQSQPLQPTSEVKYILNYYVDSRTSLDKANSLIEKSITNGRYYHAEENLFIPLCEIEEFRAVINEVKI